MNRTGGISKTTREWGSKARKLEDQLRGNNSRATRENIAEQLAEVEEEDES